MSIDIRVIWRINSKEGDADLANEWADKVLMLLGNANNVIKQIHDMSEPLNSESYNLFLSQKATFKAIQDVTDGLGEHFELNRNKSVNKKVQMVIEKIEEIKPELNGMITDIDRWFK